MLGVIDNFLDDPYLFRNTGLKLYNENNFIANDLRWPGCRVQLPDSLVKKYIPKVESAVDEKLLSFSTFFQWVDETWVSGMWHDDDSDYTVLTFLNLDAPSNTGIEIGENTITSPPRSESVKENTILKNSFYRSSRNYYDRYQFKKKLDKYNSSVDFKDPCVVSNKFNRTVIFEKSQLHRAQNFFGKGKDSRFTMISFCNVTT
tara:strand:- start:62 stop:670 length:609 start_codon:yes stop_codon:yes gene_type:complete